MADKLKLQDDSLPVTHLTPQDAWAVGPDPVTLRMILKMQADGFARWGGPGARLPHEPLKVEGNELTDALLAERNPA